MSLLAPPSPPPAALTTAIPGLALRRFDPAADFGALAELFCVANIHDGVEWAPSEASLRDDEWRPTERFDPTADVLVAEVDGRMVGVAETSWRLRGDVIYHEIGVTVHPDVRRRGLGAVLLGRIEERAREVAGRPDPDRADPDRAHGVGRTHVLGGHSEDHVAGASALVRRFGYAAHTYGFLMRRPLDQPIVPVALPDGLEVRPVTSDQHRVIWAADEEAFRDHPEPAQRDEGDFEAFFGEPELDTGLWEVAWAGDEVAGSVMNFVWTSENERLGIRRGWLEHVSVRRPWRGRGLARALVTRSLERLRSLGLDEAMLGVHGENPLGALALYEKTGFEVHRRWTRWRKPL